MNVAVLAGVAAGSAVGVFGFSRGVAADRLYALTGPPRTLGVSAGFSALGAGALGFTLGVVPAALLAVGFLVAAVFRESQRSHRETRRAREAALELVAAFAGELRAGRPLVGALRVAVEDAAPLRHRLQPAVVAAQTGGDVAHELRVAADETGIASLRALAACCAVSADSGAALAGTLDRIVAGLLRDERLREEVQSQLAGPRTTALLLAVLPCFGVLLAGGLGARPVSLLLGTPIGAGCLAVAVVLDAAGLWWMRRLVRSAMP